MYYVTGKCTSRRKGDPTRGQNSVIDVVRPLGKVSHGLCDSAPGTTIIIAKALDAVFGYGAVVAAPCADS